MFVNRFSKIFPDGDRIFSRTFGEGAKMEQIRVMSFNTLCGGPAGTPRALEGRKELMLDAIRRTQPDIIGCQEAVDGTRRWMETALAADYAMLGCGRNGDCCGEGCPVFWRRDRFTLLSCETFWLSDRPAEPGSRFSGVGQSQCPRLAHLVQLYSIPDKKSVYFLNTHLDHEGSRARALGLELLEAKLDEQPQGAIGVLTGDFNCAPQTSYFVAFTERMGAKGWQDVSAGISGTFHNMGTVEPPAKIDYIFSNAPLIKADIVEDPHEGGAWYSDHYAIYADLRF